MGKAAQILQTFKFVSNARFLIIVHRIGSILWITDSVWIVITSNSLIHQLNGCIKYIADMQEFFTLKGSQVR